MEETNNVAYCGLYCRNCGKYKKGKCPGCQKNEKAAWCKIRKCCMEHDYATCADCKDMTPRQCKNYNNIFAKFFEIVFKSDRKGAVEYIKIHGAESYIRLMDEKQSMVLKKTKKNI
jgi:hypothetical protein